MGTGELKGSAEQTAAEHVAVPAVKPPRPLHHIAEVRCQQGISLRSAARQLHIDVSEARAMQDETHDMWLSTLYRWQEVLGVPVAELLVEPEDALSPPVMKRARLVRLMKTAAAIREKADAAPLQRLVTMLIEQLIEIMPELEHVSAWHAVGQRRSLDEIGRIAEQTVPDDWYLSGGC